MSNFAERVQEQPQRSFPKELREFARQLSREHQQEMDQALQRHDAGEGSTTDKAWSVFMKSLEGRLSANNYKEWKNTKEGQAFHNAAVSKLIKMHFPAIDAELPQIIQDSIVGGEGSSQAAGDFGYLASLTDAAIHQQIHYAKHDGLFGDLPFSDKILSAIADYFSRTQGLPYVNMLKVLKYGDTESEYGAAFKRLMQEPHFIEQFMQSEEYGKFKEARAFRKCRQQYGHEEDSQFFYDFAHTINIPIGGCFPGLYLPPTPRMTSDEIGALLQVPEDDNSQVASKMRAFAKQYLKDLQLLRDTMKMKEAEEKKTGTVVWGSPIDWFNEAKSKQIAQ